MAETVMGWIQRHPIWTSVGSGLSVTWFRNQLGLDLVFGYINDQLKALVFQVLGEELATSVAHWLSFIVSVIIVATIVYLVFRAGSLSVTKPPKRPIRRPTVGPAVLMSVGVICLLLGLGWWLVERPKLSNKPDASVSTIDEAKPKTDLGWGFERHSNSPFLGLAAPNGVMEVQQFYANGRNQTNDPITKARGYIRSEKTTIEYPLLFNIGGRKLLTSDEINPIPVGAIIDAKVFFEPERKPISLQKFLAENVPFTFFFEYDGKEFRRTFKLEDIEPQIRDFEQFMRKNAIPPPQMSEKLGAQSSAINEAYWPPLTETESMALTDKLRPLVSTKMFLSCSQVECRDLARSLLAAFKAAGWQDTKLSTGGLEAVGVEGVQIFPSDGPAPQLREIIESTTDLSVTLMEVDRKFSEYQGYYLIIGSKPF